MQFLKPLPPTSEEKTFVLKSKVIGVYDKGKAGSVLETENLIMDKNTGEVCEKIFTAAERLAQVSYGVLTLGQGVHQERRLSIHDGSGQLGWTKRTEFYQLSAAQGQKTRCGGRGATQCGGGTLIQVHKPNLAESMLSEHLHGRS